MMFGGCFKKNPVFPRRTGHQELSQSTNSTNQLFFIVGYTISKEQETHSLYISYDAKQSRQTDRVDKTKGSVQG